MGQMKRQGVIVICNFRSNYAKEVQDGKNLHKLQNNTNKMMSAAQRFAHTWFNQGNRCLCSTVSIKPCYKRELFTTSSKQFRTQKNTSNHVNKQHPA